MSTTKPRITVTMEPRAHEVLSRLSGASGESMSQIIAGFVDAALPSLERLVVVLERAKTASKEVRSGLAGSVERAERALMPALQAALDQTDLFLADVSDGLSSPRAAAAPVAAPPVARKRAVSKGSTPVPVTRGSGPRKTLTRVASKGGRRG